MDPCTLSSTLYVTAILNAEQMWLDGAYYGPHAHVYDMASAASAALNR